MYDFNEFLVELVFSNKPSLYFDYLKDNNLLGYFPELNSLITCLQEPEWHPEGTVWSHTLMVIDQAAELKHNFESDFEKTAFMLGALCHDFGKPFTTIYDNGKFRSNMHDTIGVIPTNSFLKKLNINDDITLKVVSYVKNHLIPNHLYKNSQNVSKKAILRLESRIHIPDLVLLTRADHWGRTDYEAINKICKPADWLFQQYNKYIIQ